MAYLKKDYARFLGLGMNDDLPADLNSALKAEARKWAQGEEPLGTIIDRRLKEIAKAEAAAKAAAEAEPDLDAVVVEAAPPAGSTRDEQIETAKATVETAKQLLAFAERSGKTRSIEAAKADLAEAEAELAKLLPERPRGPRSVIGANTVLNIITVESDLNINVSEAVASALLRSGWFEWQVYQKKDKATGKLVVNEEGKPVMVRRWMAYHMPVVGHGEINVAFYTGTSKLEEAIKRFAGMHPGTWYPQGDEDDLSGVNIYDNEPFEWAPVVEIFIGQGGFQTGDIVRPTRTTVGPVGGDGKKKTEVGPVGGPR